MARHTVRLRPVITVSSVDFRAHLLVDKIQPVLQQLHANPP